MREIKFRCFEQEKGMWGQDSNSAMNLALFWAYVADIKGNPNVMQYTELKDKNGKEIYEGDIVKWSDGDYEHPSNPRIAEVRFDPELCFFAFNVDGGHKFGFSNFIYTDTEKHIEIIGNIYENPELLNPHTT